MELTFRLSAFKHGVTGESIKHAVAHSLFIDDDFQGTEPPKVLIIGPDPAGNLLELVGQFSSDDTLVVFHAMAIRPSILKMIGPLDR